jgi:hypothetical protein
LKGFLTFDVRERQLGSADLSVNLFGKIQWTEERLLSASGNWSKELKQP